MKKYQNRLAGLLERPPRTNHAGLGHRSRLETGFGVPERSNGQMESTKLVRKHVGLCLNRSITAISGLQCFS